MCDAYLQRNPKKHCETMDNIPAESAYDGYIDFFKRYLKP